MKTYRTVPVRVTAYSRLARWDVASERNLPRRFERFTESSDGDERDLGTQWIDKVCFASIVISVFYFIPMFVRCILK
jgi:hypothetical protein